MSWLLELYYSGITIPIFTYIALGLIYAAWLGKYEPNLDWSDIDKSWGPHVIIPAIVGVIAVLVFPFVFPIALTLGLGVLIYRKFRVDKE